jgi:hypothetical protein
MALSHPKIKEFSFRMSTAQGSVQHRLRRKTERNPSD